MSQQSLKSKREYLEQLLQELDGLREKGDKKAICTALTDLGLAHFNVRNYVKGTEAFEEAVQIARELKDLDLQVHSLGMHTLAFQTISRLPDAFNKADEIRELGIEHNRPEIICDAVTNQGQILLESGDQLRSLEKLEEARGIAYELGDKRRQMNVIGAYGQHSLTVPDLGQAEVYFDKALALAQELGDEQAENGYLGNRGMIYEWRGEFGKAAPIFEKVLGFVQEDGDEKAEIQAMRHLTKVYNKLENNEKVLEYALPGLELAKEGDVESAFILIEALIMTYYRMGELEKAQASTEEAIEMARSSNDRRREIRFLISLGEAFLAADDLEKALTTYEKALAGAKHINQDNDVAYLTGRIGFTLAELGKLDDAIPFHEEAIDMAQDGRMPSLEGQQLSMLSMAYLEKSDKEKALDYASKAVDVYKSAKLFEEFETAQALVAEINAA
ncbi:MAG: hypothetical protein DWQ07_05425 [Chloroflexi bacterium]|nr:MAG: hypothetical protein DWQ07_05425 [Chloroflexota bacterium]MBL1194874.1 hypothetical protein [Chloroflexota bacterium]NOH12165.1 tetratricopeptide repeat protein [Chloroflexota bacterium]